MTCPALDKSFLYFVYFAYFPTYFKCTNAKNIIFQIKRSSVLLMKSPKRSILLIHFCSRQKRRHILVEIFHRCVYGFVNGIKSMYQYQCQFSSRCSHWALWVEQFSSLSSSSSPSSSRGGSPTQFAHSSECERNDRKPPVLQ